MAPPNLSAVVSFISEKSCIPDDFIRQLRHDYLSNFTGLFDVAGGAIGVNVGSRRDDILKSLFNYELRWLSGPIS